MKNITAARFRYSQPRSDGGTLVARARQGDQDAISELLRKYSPQLRRVAWRVVRNWADAEDVTQAGLWKACQHLSEYEERASISTWLTRIVLNEGVGLLRRRRTQPADIADRDLRSDEVRWPLARTETPEQIASFNETERIVRQCMDRIHADHRTILYFRILDELSHQEIAERLGLSVQAVKLRFHRARQVLQGMLHQRGAGIARLNHGERLFRETRERRPGSVLTQ
jgi:RNA polymerase sigma-70 factor (ECF subfamily)